MLKKIYKIGEQELFKNYKKECMKNHNLKNLFWECTLLCNLKCKHCGSRAGNNQYTDELTTEEIKNAFKQIADSMDVSDIFINVTGGEPLMRKDLYDVMEYATNTLGFHWGMTSNGMLLTDANIEKLKKAKLDTIAISIDGLEKTHDSFRGVPGSYKTIINNIQKLKEANFLNHIQVTTVFHKENIDELEELYNVMQSLNLDSWRLATIDPIGRAMDNKNLLLNGTEIKKVLDFIKNNKKNKKLKLLYGCPGYLGLDYENEVRPKYFNCRTGISIASILYNGNLFVCPDVPRIPRLIQGNIRKDSFKDVWENKYKEFRLEDRTSCIECQKCDKWEYCLGGAFHTWDFEKNIQKKCTYKLIYNK